MVVLESGLGTSLVSMSKALPYEDDGSGMP